MPLDRDFVNKFGDSVVTVWVSSDYMSATCKVSGKTHKFKGETALSDANRCANNALINMIHVEGKTIVQVA